MHILLDALDEGLEKIYGMVLEGCEVRMALYSQEDIPTPLVIDGMDTYTSRFDLYFDANIAAVTCCRCPALFGSTIL